MLADGHSVGESYSCIAVLNVLLRFWGTQIQGTKYVKKLLLICCQQTAEILKESCVIG